MIFPLSFIITNPLYILILPVNGLLFPTNLYFPETLFDFSFIFSMMSNIFRNFIVGIIIAFPGIYFNYSLARTPLNKSFWKRGIACAAAIYFITLGITLFLSMTVFSPYSPLLDDLYYLYSKILYYPSLVMAVFIVLPLFLRQATIISVPPDLHDYSMRDIESTPKFNVSREKMLSAIFWLVICFAPYAIEYDIYSWYGSYMATSFLMDYSMGSSVYYITDIVSLSFQGQIAMLPNMPFLALQFAFNFAFVRDIYRYLRKTITQHRLIAMATLGCLFPLLFAIGTSGLFVFRSYTVLLPIPIPIIQIVGLLMVRYHHPHIIQSDRVWRGDSSAMWWETERRKREEPIVHQTAPEKPIRHGEEVITVPLIDLFLSRIRKLKWSNNSESENRTSLNQRQES